MNLGTPRPPRCWLGNLRLAADNESSVSRGTDLEPERRAESNCRFSQLPAPIRAGDEGAMPAVARSQVYACVESEVVREERSP